MRTFNQGDTVYTTDARECVYVAASEGGHIVREVLDTDFSAELPMGQPELHWKVYSTPPQSRYAEEAAKARALLDEINSDLAEARSELSKLTLERAAALKALASHPQLVPVIEYIEGRLTHAAVFGQYGSGIRIIPLADALKPSDLGEEREGYVRLLALYGGKNGPAGPSRNSYDDKLIWRINRYSDGSGNESQLCILGPSEEVVRQRLQAFLDANWEKRGVWSEHTIEKWAADALKLGLRVPSWLEKKVAENEAKARQASLNYARKNIVDCRDRLAKAEQELASILAAQPAQGEGEK